MSLLSFFRKNKQADAGDDSASSPRSEPASQAVRARKRKTAARDSADGSSNTPVDPVLPEKKRARRRLVGAVALVLAVVIGLPMVLDSEPKPLADDLTIEIPSKDRPAESAVARGAVAPSSRVPAASALDRKEEVVEMPSTPAPGKAAHPVAPDDLKPKTDTAENKQTRFILQVAAFASADKVQELRGKLKSAGIASYTQKVATTDGERIRIRVGPFGTRQEAERMQAKLSTLGLAGKLLPPP
ncbi:MAG: SPOR domain-containing protein [Herminiimonas sp.]|nr:SPOR domain-containing protein [Herminiimonas sp.]